MVKVWAARITPLFDKTNYAFYYEKLPEWRKEKADRLKSENAKAQSVGAWSLWTRLQQQEKLGEDTPFNLSHSGEYVLCAFSDCKEAQVGCDLEMIGEYREKVAKRGGICTYNRNRQRRGAKGNVLPLLGAEGELYESHPKGDGT